MEQSAALTEGMAMLNDAQREAVEHIDGPLLVIAGPGTGKTQLLSLRAANILGKRDVAPQNVLCLTYTEAGAEAMRKRLIQLIGRQAYGIEVCTFHGFASSLRTRYPERFTRSANSQLISDLQQKKLIDSFLKELPFGTQLSGERDGKSAAMGNVLSFISQMKRNGIEPATLRAIAQQTAASVEYLEGTELLSLVNAPIPRKKIEKIDFVSSLKESFVGVCSMAPKELTTPVVKTPGVYVPYLTWLRDFAKDTSFVDDDGKTAAYGAFRKKVFKGSGKEGYAFSVPELVERLGVATDVYERYQRHLVAHCLHDYDDMIMDAILAVAADEGFKYELQDRYRYIQVDEFQDTNGAQMRIVELLCDGIDAPNVMAVGDDDQAIMRFQGASIACINQFDALYHPKSVVLKTNYRSTPAIVDLGQEVAAQVEERLPQSATDKDIVAFNPDGDQLTFEESVFASRELELQAMAADIRRKIDEGYVASAKNPDEAIAVIAPKHASLKALIPYLKEQEVAFAYNATSEIFSLEPMQTLLACLRFVRAYARGREEVAAVELPQIVAAPEFGGTKESAIRFAVRARREFRGNWLLALESVEEGPLHELWSLLVSWSAAALSRPVRPLMYEMAKPSIRHWSSRQEAEPLAFAELAGGIRALLSFAEGEVGTAAVTGRTLNLVDVCDRLEEARDYGVTIDANVKLQTTGAVRLTSAHSSKGLEFDLVYLLDSDDNTWHSQRSGTKIIPPNLLVDTSKSEDDARRLLFVAITRAKRHLRLYRSEGNPLRELQGLIESVEVAPTAQGMACALQTDWRANYELDAPQLRELLKGDLSTMKLSASALNQFLAYEPGCGNSVAFGSRQVMRLPEAPQAHMEFGTIVHAYLEDYVNQVIGQGVPAAPIAAQARKRIEALDYPEEEVRRLLQRFESVSEVFVPELAERIEGRPVTESWVGAIVGDGVPLVGKLDLMLIDHARKTIRVVDYKTGFTYPTTTPGVGYERQLRFYRLLIEASPEYQGYHVTSLEDWYVEPEKDTHEPHPAIAAQAPTSAIEWLEQVIEAVWHRIQQGNLDTSAFEQSGLFVQASAEAEHARSKTACERIMQDAYERWLVQEDQAR